MTSTARDQIITGTTVELGRQNASSRIDAGRVQRVITSAAQHQSAAVIEQQAIPVTARRPVAEIATDPEKRKNVFKSEMQE